MNYAYRVMCSFLVVVIMANSWAMEDESTVALHEDEESLAEKVIVMRGDKFAQKLFDQERQQRAGKQPDYKTFEEVDLGKPREVKDLTVPQGNEGEVYQQQQTAHNRQQSMSCWRRVQQVLSCACCMKKKK